MSDNGRAGNEPSWSWKFHNYREGPFSMVSYSLLIVKVIVDAFNQEKAML